MHSVIVSVTNDPADDVVPVLINFDDRPYDTSSEAVLLGSDAESLYEGFIWEAWGSYQTGVDSQVGLGGIEYSSSQDSDHEVYNGYAHKYLKITRPDGAEFDFNSGVFGNGGYADAISNDKANSLSIKGLNNGQVQFEDQINLTSGNMVLQTFDFTNIDELTITVTGGGYSGNDVSNTGWYAMDDLMFTV